MSFKLIGNVFISLIFLCSAGAIHTSYNKKPIIISKQDSALNINFEVYKFFSMGNKRLISDLLWIITLLESDLEHYQKHDANSWMFHRFNTISNLNPKFYEVYQFGGTYLSILKDDLEGADIIFSKGLKIYPDDYRLLINAGFLNYFELNNQNKGYEILKKIERHPKAPPYLWSIINKLKISVDGDLVAAFKIVFENYRYVADPSLKKKLHLELYALKAEIDLKCLNSGRTNCSLTDFNGVHYIKDKNIYKASIPFKLYRIKNRTKKS